MGSEDRKRRRDTYIPEPSQETHQRPQKRPRSDSEDFKPDYGNGESYRPRYDDSDRKKDTRRPRRNDRASSRPDFSTPNNHKKSYRNANPSTRIKSLQKQLDHASAATMPANILAEKERELAFLKSGQQQKQSKYERSKIIGRYHKIRFFERKKAERTLKRLRKTVERIEAGSASPSEAKPTSDDLSRAQVDILYTLYAPLEKKYIAIFPQDLSEDWRNKKPHKSEAQKTEDDGAIIRLAASSNGFRPAQWQKVAQVVLAETTTMMESDTEEIIQVPPGNDHHSSVSVTPAQLQALEAMRDGTDQTPASNGDTLTMRGKTNNTKTTWQTDSDRAVAPEEADDSDVDDYGNSNSGQPNRRQAGGSKKKRLKEVEMEVDEDSDGDGGFFER